MNPNLPLSDRIRLERAIWTLDTLIQFVPGKARKAIRTELRANLRAAAIEVGAAKAVSDLGNLRRLALEYLSLEYGEGRPRPTWLKATFWACASAFLLEFLTFAGLDGYAAGVEAAAPHPLGTYTWHGMLLFGGNGFVTYTDHGQTAIGIEGSSWSILAWLAIPLVAALLGGRMWRAIPLLRRRLATGSK
jgi:hypothetical protein